MKNQLRKRSAYWTGILLLTAAAAVCSALSRLTPFCDFYADYIFPAGLQTFGRLTGIFPFSVGEMLILLAGALLLLQIFLLLFLITFRKKSRYKQFVINYSKLMLAAAIVTAWTVTMNCSTLYNCSRLDINGNRNKNFEPEQIRELRDFIVGQCNTLSELMKRDENGDVATEGDINKKVREAMKKLSVKFPRLSGYYPDPKPIAGSFLMYQTGYDGVYFPFSLEANYNTYISDIRYPHVASHELAHLKGYIYEDEADFIAYLACVGSDDKQLQYAGYLGVLNYIDSDYRHSVQNSGEPSALKISDRVRSDAASYTAATYEKLAETREVIDSEIVASASREFTDAYMEYYGAEPNYAEVTKLLLAYYEKM